MSTGHLCDLEHNPQTTNRDWNELLVVYPISVAWVWDIDEGSNVFVDLTIPVDCKRRNPLALFIVALGNRTHLFSGDRKPNG
ncbi:hypothetical protein FOXYSP1_11347 [Fusarium oxysporum f. sp. phaseoli]